LLRDTSGGSGVWSIDPDVLVPALVDDRPLAFPTWDAEGRTWALLEDGAAIVEVTADGLLEHPLPDLPERYTDLARVGLLVDRDLWILLVEAPHSGQVGRPIRIPRPSAGDGS